MLRREQGTDNRFRRTHEFFITITRGMPIVRDGECSTFPVSSSLTTSARPSHINLTAPCQEQKDLGVQLLSSTNVSLISSSCFRNGSSKLGAGDRHRTCALLLKRELLYRTELRQQIW